MKKLLAVIAALLLVPVCSSGQETRAKKLIIFPFKVVSKNAGTSSSTELAAVLGAELSRDGDVQIMSGVPFVSALTQSRVEPDRMERIAARVGADAVVWGTLTQLEDGQSLEVWVLDRKNPTRPRMFSTTGKDVETVISGMKDLAVEMGSIVLDRPKIDQIQIEGNKTIKSDDILNKMKMKPGTPFRKSAIAEDVRELYKMGYFDDVKITAEPKPDGTVDIKVSVKERPLIKEVKITGNTVFSTDEILDSLTTKSLRVASVDRIRADIEKLKKMYEGKGYYDPKIDFEIKEISSTEATLTFKIDEGHKSYLTEIDFEGVDPATKKELKKALNIKEKSWTWFLDESGTFTRDKLEENRIRLIQYYFEKGHIQVQVGAPKVEMKDSTVKVTYPISEGERFQIRKVDVTGRDLGIPKEKLLEALKTKPQTYVKRSLIAEDIRDLQRLFNNMGYAYVDIEPLQKINEQHHFMDITYKIDKGEKITVERVDIAGNERTRDKVIRRSIAVAEGELYNADQMEETKKNLESMDYFDAVRLKSSPGSRPDLMNVTVEVAEKKTGSLSAGIGYSSQDGAMGNVDLKERNLFGMGIVANAKASLSGRRNNYDGTLTYPWLLDYPVTLSVGGHKDVQKETYYLKEGDGFSANLSYPLYGAWSMTSGIGRDSSKLTQFEKVFALSVVDYYRRYNTSAQKYMNIAENYVSLGIGRDTRIGTVIPRGGTKISIGTRLSGFGGDVAMSRYFTEAIYYYPIYWKAIVKLRAHGTILAESGKEPIPFDRRIVLGGIQTIRGYQQGEIGPQDRFGNIIGGDRALFGNVECLFPLVETMNLNGVVFFDAGNAWNAVKAPMVEEVKAGYGVGVRWMSPMGPIRLEYGWKISPRRGEEKGAWAFAMGQLF